MLLERKNKVEGLEESIESTQNEAVTQDEAFWKGCSSCSNYEILKSKNYQMCLCTGMLAPSKVESMKLDLSDQIVTEVKNEQA